jgi:hypothetical protein
MTAMVYINSWDKERQYASVPQYDMFIHDNPMCDDTTIMLQRKLISRKMEIPITYTYIPTTLIHITFIHIVAGKIRNLQNPPIHQVYCWIYSVVVNK